MGPKILPPLFPPTRSNPTGKTVELSPGAYHVMMMDLKAALPKDSTVPLTLVLKDAKGRESKVELKVPVALSMDASLHKH